MTILSNVSEVMAEVLEPLFDNKVVDSLTNNQIIRDLPCLGIPVRTALLGKTVSDWLFLAKVRRFLKAIDPTTAVKARKFADELESGNKDAARTAQVLLLALDAMDDLEKAPIIAALFAAFLRGEITKPDFRRMMNAVTSAVTDDLLELASLGSEPSGFVGKHATLINSLRHTGLTGDSSVTVIAGEADFTEAVSPLGQSFLRAMANFDGSQNK
jgi:hypothetical protein